MLSERLIEIDQLITKVAILDGKVNPRYDWINGCDAIKDWVYDLPDGTLGRFRSYTYYHDDIIRVIKQQPSHIQEKIMFHLHLVEQVRFTYLATAEQLCRALVTVLENEKQ